MLGERADARQGVLHVVDEVCPQTRRSCVVVVNRFKEFLSCFGQERKLGHYVSCRRRLLASRTTSEAGIVEPDSPARYAETLSSISASQARATASGSSPASTSKPGKRGMPGPPRGRWSRSWT